MIKKDVVLRLLRLESEIIMKFINKLKCNHYVILAIFLISSLITLLAVILPLNSGSTDEIQKQIKTVAMFTTTTDSTTTTIATITNTTTTTTATTTTATTTTATTIVITNTTTSNIISVTENVQTTPILEIIEEVVVEPTSIEEIIPYTVYKPSTHYIHRNTCRWVDSSCVEVDDTNDIECRKCTECNPDLEIIHEYIPQITITTNNTTNTTITTTDNDRQMLAEIVWHEAGSSWISQYNKAKIAAGVMNRVNDSRFPNTVYGVLTQPYQFSGFSVGYCTPTQECYDAVDYYFSHIDEFNSDNSWYGDGRQNHFYYQ